MSFIIIYFIHKWKHLYANSFWWFKEIKHDEIWLDNFTLFMFQFSFPSRWQNFTIQFYIWSPSSECDKLCLTVCESSSVTMAAKQVGHTAFGLILYWNKIWTKLKNQSLLKSIVREAVIICFDTFTYATGSQCISNQKILIFLKFIPLLKKEYQIFFETWWK